MTKPGTKLSEEHRRKISEANKGKHNGKFSDEHKTKISESLKGNSNCLGHVVSEEARKKISESMQGNKRALGKGDTHLGHRPSEEQRRKQSEAMQGRFTGPTRWNWKGGVTPLRQQFINDPQYKKWRRSVFERDDFTCQLRGSRGGQLHAHHIKTVSRNPELIYDVDNGITLSKKGHESIRGREDQYVEQFMSCLELEH